MSRESIPPAAAAAAAHPGGPAPSPAGAASPVTAGTRWGRWLALGWLVLFVLGCLAVALPSPTLLQRLDLRAVFRGDAPTAPVDAPGEE